jgi:hypothetical protein
MYTSIAMTVGRSGINRGRNNGTPITSYCMSQCFDKSNRKAIFTDASNQKHLKTRKNHQSLLLNYIDSRDISGGNRTRSELEQRLCPLKYGSSIDPVVGHLPNKAKIVIVGGGAQGMAIAYKLALKGYGPDTVIIDQGQMGGGSTWNSAGIVSMLAKSSVEMKLTK